MRQIGGACKKCDFCARNRLLKWFTQISRKGVHEKSFERDKTFFRDLRDNQMFVAAGNPAAALHLFFSLRARRNSTRVAAACHKTIRMRRGTVSPLSQKSRAKPCDFLEALFVKATYYRNRAHSPLFLKAAGMRQIGCAKQGSQKSQRSEIFGKRRSGARMRALPF